MACDVVSSPFQEASAFEDDWQKAVGDASHGSGGGLDLIAEFNAACDTNTTAFDDNASSGLGHGNGIDPHLLHSATASPEPNSDIFDPGFQDPFSSYPDFNQPTPANTPYFHHPTQIPMVPVFASPVLRNSLHRRSVSEPPESFPHHHHQPQRPHFLPSGPPMTFTRDGHFLGQPKPQHPTSRAMKNASKGKAPYRGQPYAVKGAPPPGPARYEFRQPRSHAQTIGPGGPTSMPRGVYTPGPPPPPPLQRAYTTSRVCTPAPSPVFEPVGASPGVIDPVLKGLAVEEKKVVAIPVEELRSLITEAVRKAVQGIEAGKKGDDCGDLKGLSDAVAGGGDEDEIVVASVETRDVAAESVEGGGMSMEL